MPSIVALIPARAGSKRIPGKNTKDFFGHPLIAYTIHAAKESGIFSEIVVSSDDGQTVTLGWQYGATRGHDRSRPTEDSDPDILWVRECLDWLARPTRPTGAICPDAFAILRPTSPFRTAETIQRAWREFQAHPCDSIRAVEPAKQNPHKMWFEGHMDLLVPAFPGMNEYQPLAFVPWHSCPTQSLPQYFIQTAGLEMAWTRCVLTDGSISGALIRPFFMEGYESLDINSPDDWARATSLVDRGLVALPALATQTATAPSL